MDLVAATCDIFQGDRVLSRAELQPLLSGTSLAASKITSSPVSMGSAASGGCNDRVLQKEGGIKVALENKNLWKQFYGIPNEMIVTKVGRYIDVYCFFCCCFFVLVLYISKILLWCDKKC